MKEQIKATSKMPGTYYVLIHSTTMPDIVGVGVKSKIKKKHTLMEYISGAERQNK